MKALIVDGHSMIFAWPEYLKAFRKKNVLAREMLINALTAYQDATGHHVVVVFDGSGPKPTDASIPGGIQIFYAGGGKTADDIIERLVASKADHREIVVATNDTMEQQTVHAAGASWMTADDLAQALRDAETEIRRRILSLRKSPPRPAR